MPRDLQKMLHLAIDALPNLNLDLVVQQVTEMLHGPNLSIRKVGQLIENNHQLSRAFIRHTEQETLRELESVHQALRSVSLTTIKRIMAALAMGKSPKGPSSLPAFALMNERLQLHSQAVAIACQLLAMELELPDLSDAYLAGLFHDIGEGLIGYYSYDDLADVLKLTQIKAVSLCAAEDQVLGLNHAYIGSKMLEHWAISPAIVEAVRCHHAPDQATKHPSLAMLVHLADAAVYSHERKLPIGHSLCPVSTSRTASQFTTRTHLAAVAAKAFTLLR